MLQILRYTAFYVVLFLLLSSCAAIKGVKEVSCHLVDTISRQDLHLATTYNVEVGNSVTICCSDRCFEEIMQLGVNGTNIWRFRSKGPQKTDDYFGVKPPKKDPIINKKGRELGSRASIFRSIATQLS